MKVLVLGGSGQIGEPLCEYLRKCSHEVINIDLKNGPDNDLRSNQLMFDTHFKWCDFVFFLAFDVGGSTYLKKYEHTKEFLNNNVKIMKTVFDKLEKWQKPFVFASSQMSNMSHSPYGVLKRLGEFYTRSLGGINVKFWNVYGVEDPKQPDKFHVITDFANSAYKDGTILMKTSGMEERNFLYADDCCEALQSLCENYTLLDKSVDYDIASYNWTNILEIANIISKQFEGCSVVPGSLSDSVQSGYKNEPNREILKYWNGPKISLEDGIKLICQSIIDE